MFVNAIEKVAYYTRAIHYISRMYGGNKIIPGAATLFFVNEEGYAVTCNHVVTLLGEAERANKKFQQFRQEKEEIVKKGGSHRQVAKLEQQYQYHKDAVVQIKNTFVDCLDSMQSFTWFNHPHYDLAIIKFNGFKQKLYQGHAVFAKHSSQLRQGQYLCRLGFPFPEFSNFRYDPASDDIVWTNEGIRVSPRFPTEGMVTRFLADSNGKYGIEMSTPGLRGQSGGPLFDTNGLVYGMQSRTKHLHLGFDIEDKEIITKGQSKKVNDYSFIHLGECIDADIIKQFLRQHNVKYYEG